MGRTRLQRIAEAEDLLQRVASWSPKELDELPRLYREKAIEYRQLWNSGEG